MNFMFVISLFLLKRQIAFHNFLLHPVLAYRAVEHSKGFAAEKETHRGGITSFQLVL